MEFWLDGNRSHYHEMRKAYYKLKEEQKSDHYRINSLDREMKKLREAHCTLAAQLDPLRPKTLAAYRKRLKSDIEELEKSDD